MLAVMGTVADKASCGRSVFGYGIAIRGTGGTGRAAQTGKIAGKDPLSPSECHAEPYPDEYRCLRLEDISSRPQRSLPAGCRKMNTEGPSTYMRVGKRR